jgi:condensation enzyme
MEPPSIQGEGMTAMEDRLPVSNQQRLWCTPETAGAFSPGFIIARALRITGPVDAVALQAALDDVVTRHEALRTVVVRDARPPYQQVHPPMPVPLTIRELPSDPSRQQVAEEQLAEAETASLDVEQLPLLRATLGRFDDQDSILTLLSHHSACDGWSMNVLVRDLVACYAARTGERPLDLPDVPRYQDYTRWQLDTTAQPAAAATMAYWREQLDGAHLFTLPTDRPITSPIATYVRHPFTVDSDVAAAFSRFVKAERFSGTMVQLAVFNVLAHRIRGTLDPTVNVIIHGRTEPEFQGTVGVFLNFLSMRTDLAGCSTFRDVLIRTRVTCLQAYEHEVLQHQVREAVPSLSEPLASPSNAYMVFGYWDAALTSATGGPYLLSEGATVLFRRSRASETLPGGVTWNMGMSSWGELGGGVQFSPDIFDESTVADWVSDYCRILAMAMADPDREWQEL